MSTAEREALEAIANARRKVSECPTPGHCMFPQHHADDESATEFAERLRRMAKAALEKRA